MEQAAASDARAMATRGRIQVKGIVQGVGFRPFVYRLARKYALAGYAYNNTCGVFIELEGEREAILGFVAELAAHPPPLARIESLEFRNNLPPIGLVDFAIAESAEVDEKFALISPDIATCRDCERELFDPADRRHRYPFTNCTDCGPRFTIIKDIPYDREKTTMAVFPMCPACEREYHDPNNRRFHAQPNR